MPQMAPLSWLTLMMAFMTILVMFNMTNYYSFLYKNKSLKEKTLKTFKTNWKW
uniref:ATP synthase complex subunit 8 n=1 Tax=Adelium sp. NCS-2009 TaxID=590155 RepID=D1G5Q1_9CUCU|nr:ATP synthase F0 subunit 8 [Adelium sp. NCS-2009]ACM45066.1 ATP synthase F0 subunit 8 [Adelium sp. NCS-2009]